MKNFRITEEEVKNILSMHKSLMNEQLEKGFNPNDPQYLVLVNAQKLGCLSNGEPFRDRTTGVYYYRKPSTKVKSDIDFFGDMTYKFVDGSKSGKWKCEGLVTLDNIKTDIEREIQQNNYQRREDIEVSDSELAQLYEKHPKYNIWKLKIKTSKVTGFTEEQKEFIKQWKEQETAKGNPGYTETLTPAQRAKGTFKAIKVSGTEQLFPNGGLTMYREPAVASNDIKSCKEAIEKYYTYWREDSEELTDSEFNSLKPFVQSCANRYHKRWGGVFSAIDNYVKILTGDEPGGPSSYGSDSKFRLKSPKNVRR